MSLSRRSQPRFCKGVPGADISQLPLGAGRGAPAVPLAGQQLRFQLRLRPGAMTVGGGRLRETRRAWSLSPGPEPPAPSAPTICRENWCLPAPAGSLPRQKPGEVASPKQRLSLYLFILLFLLSICSGRRGGGGGGCVCVVRKWWKQTKLCWCEGFCMTREGPFWGSITMEHSTSGPSYPPPPAGWPIFIHNVFRSLPQPTDSRWSRWNVTDSRHSVSAVGVTFRSKRVHSLP